MKNLFVQNLINRGTVLAEGFLFSAKMLPEQEIRRRIVSLWRPGVRVLRHGKFAGFAESNEFVFLQLPQPLLVDCSTALGLPLVRYNKILSSFPLSKSDLEIFKDLNEAIVWFVAGDLQTIEIRSLEIEEVKFWFDVSAFQTIETQSLGVITPKPVLLKRVVEVNLREQLGASVPPPDAEMVEILKILRQKKAASLKNKSNSTVGSQNYSGLSAPSINLPNVFSNAFGALKNLFGDNKNSVGQNAFAEPPKPSDISNKLRQLWTKTLFQMRIAQIFNRRQAKYLTEMMEMFERGDLQEALKHAIPLEDMQSLRELTENAPFLGFLRPRNDLQIKLGQQIPSNSSVFLENEWFDQLSKTYRQTFERLTAQGKIEEAAFVLAELLKSNAETVEFLEKHGKLRLAAELAESRNLSKEIVVRQWFIAGEKRRAIQLAVLHNCFEYVVTKLEKENHPQSGELREIWAESLAASGNLPAAVNAIWSLTEKRAKAAVWIDQAIEFGGLPAAQMLVKKIMLFPASFAEVKEKLFEFLPEASAEAAEKRIGFAREATIQTPNDELRLLARPVIKKILADWTENSTRFSPHEFRQLVAVANDFALRTDLPTLPSTQKVKQKTEVFNFEIAARDQGASCVFDACLLPDGKIVLALGEAGVKILSRENKLIEHFDQPTQKFVVSELGTAAVGLMPRGKSYRLTKFDFLQKRAQYWCEAVFDTFASAFDGNLWFVGAKDALYAIDISASDFEAVWQVSEMGGDVYEIFASKTKLMVLVNLPGKGFEKWWYDLPNLVLRSRNQMKGWHETQNENQWLANLTTSVARSIAVKQELIEDKPRFSVEIYDYENKIGQLQFLDQTIDLEKPQIAEDGYVIANRTENETTVTLYSFPNKKIAEFHLHQTKAISTKLDKKNLTITDELGRVVVFDYREEVLSKNLRY